MKKSNLNSELKQKNGNKFDKDLNLSSDDSSDSNETYKDKSKKSSEKIHEIIFEKIDRTTFSFNAPEQKIVFHNAKGPNVEIKESGYRSIDDAICKAEDVQMKSETKTCESRKMRLKRSQSFEDSYDKCDKAKNKKKNDHLNELKICRICKLDRSSDSFIEPCACKGDNRWSHANCLAKSMELSREYKFCILCKMNYRTDKFKIITKRKSCWSFFRESRKNFACLFEVPLYLGFIFFLTTLGVIQYEQSYKVIYIHWSVILIFLTILVVLNHCTFFVINIYDLVKKVKRFTDSNFNVTINIR